jgi:hypothetical protein
LVEKPTTEDPNSSTTPKPIAPTEVSILCSVRPHLSTRRTDGGWWIVLAKNKSPGNVYLHWFERAFHAPNGPATWAKAKIVRYADDLVILAWYQGNQLQRWLY